MRMAKALPALCFLLLHDLIVSALEFNLSPATFDFSSFQYNGSAFLKDNKVWLTHDPASTTSTSSQSSQGRLYYLDRVPFIDDTRQPNIAASFSTSFTFEIITTSDYGNCADGIAFFISPDLETLPASGGAALGLANGNLSTQQSSRHLFAVEFDTYQNPTLDDPSASHIGIDVNSLKSIATIDTSLGSGLHPELYLYSNYTFRAWVDYDSPSGLISVRMTNSTSDQRPEAPILSIVQSLSTVFNKYMYVGFSATTGSSFEAHNILSWNFSTSGLVISPAPAPYPEPQSPRNGLWKVGLGVGLGTFSVVLCIVVIFSVNRCHKLRVRSGGSNEDNIETSLQQYYYRELRRATQGFSDKLLIGEGAFSRVYKATGCGPDKSTVAVKRLNRGLGKASFSAEARIISSIRHRNLLHLLGWCCEKGEAMLVYQYMANGSLDRHLFGQQGGIFLSSDIRFNILLGVAAGLEYLHEGLGECVLHRDIKAANVLLDDKLQPLVGDFGLARLIGHDEVVMMTAAGTPGYVAPEVAYSGKANDRSDVYSFGALALEVACGRRAIDLQLQPQEVSLLAWVWLLYESNKLMDAVDAIMVETTTAWGEEAQEKWRCVLHVALLCCHPVPEFRPKMQQVHQVLKEVRLLALPSSRPNHPYSNIDSASAFSAIFSSSGVASSFSSTKSVGRRPRESSFSASASTSIQSDISSHVELQPPSLKSPRSSA